MPTYDINFINELSKNITSYKLNSDVENYLNNILLSNALHKPNSVQHAELKQSIISQFRRTLVAIRIKPGSALRM